jgi:hypothetical protein
LHENLVSVFPEDIVPRSIIVESESTFTRRCVRRAFDELDVAETAFNVPATNRKRRVLGVLRGKLAIETFTTHALRLGVLALRQASGSLDADVIRREGDQLLSSVGAVLHERTSKLSSALAKTMQPHLGARSVARGGRAVAARRTEKAHAGDR